MIRQLTRVKPFAPREFENQPWLGFCINGKGLNEAVFLPELLKQLVTKSGEDSSVFEALVDPTLSVKMTDKAKSKIRNVVTSFGHLDDPSDGQTNILDMLNGFGQQQRTTNEIKRESISSHSTAGNNGFVRSQRNVSASH